MADPTYKERAARYADDLLDEYSEVPLVFENVRDLIAVAWLSGSMAGSQETIDIIKRDLAS